jgi:ABC-type Mn2+/Zn2+ transport system permease subunit
MLAVFTLFGAFALALGIDDNQDNHSQDGRRPGLVPTLATPADVSDLLDPFQLPFLQRAAFEIVLLAPLAGLLGAQIVLRHLAFYTHGVGAATFPGLVVAGPAGIAPPLAALGTGLGFAAGLERLSRSTRMAYDVATALLLVAALAIGTVLASDVFESGAGVDQLLFGTLLAIGGDELAVTGAALGVVLLAAATCRRVWIATGFDSTGSSALRGRAAFADWALLVAIAIAVVAAVDAVGALLVSAILVTPAATARLFAGSVRSLELFAGVIGLAEGLAGLWIAYQLDVPPGAAIATLGGAGFALAAGFRRLAGSRIATARWEKR